MTVREVQQRAVDGFVFSRVTTRPERLNAHKLLMVVQRDAPAIERAVAGLANFNGLLEVVRASQRKGRSNPFKEEAYLVAFEARLKREGLPKLPDRLYFDFRREGLGLDMKSELSHVWTQCVARFHDCSPEKIPEAVRLLVGGAPDAEPDTLLHGAAVLLVDEEIFRRRKGLRPEQLPDLRYSVVRQWVRASGASREQDLDAVERMIADDLNRRLGSMPAGYAKLDPSCLQRAQHLAAMVGRPGDTRLVFSIFRCLQRCAAIAVDGRVQWRAEWLRGPRADRDAIPGTSTMQDVLGQVLRTHVFELEKGHSGATGAASTYRLREPIPLGGMDHSEAARALGLELNAKGIPKRS